MPTTPPATMGRTTTLATSPLSRPSSSRSPSCPRLAMDTSPRRPSMVASSVSCTPSLGYRSCWSSCLRSCTYPCNPTPASAFLTFPPPLRSVTGWPRVSVGCTAGCYVGGAGPGGGTQSCLLAWTGGAK